MINFGDEVGITLRCNQKQKHLCRPKVAENALRERKRYVSSAFYRLNNVIILTYNRY